MAPPASIKPDRPPTPFERRVYAVTAAVPRGRVTTYAAVAQVLASSPRAVGQALKRNPFAPTVPCHRVVAASGLLGGFSGEWGAGSACVQRKRRLLAEEGVGVEGGRCDARAVMAADALAAAVKASGREVW